MLTVIATCVAKPGCEADVEAGLRGLLEPTRAEDGCINYDLHVLQDRPGTFVFYENWRDKAALDAHANSAHMQAWGARKDALIAQPVEILLADMLSEPLPWRPV